ncbi:hypothetical protein X777_11334 [Ooceraea biroi]|uniref:Uncharacterized protein n=1 Tax=Ooceraea biroi TaxID=2015173 RepID=A0A026W280_OOCBI|nr:hypothetical protein X777_11334 [Ooceraea biroi]
MSNYLPNEVVDILLILGECHRNDRRAARVYAQQYPNRRHPADHQIRNIEIRSRTNLFHRQRQRNRLQNNNAPRVLTILGLVHINPQISIRQAQNQIGIPKATIHCILQSVRYHPYHITLVQELNANDHRIRAQFCRLDILDQDPEFFWNVLSGDETTFHSNGSRVCSKHFDTNHFIMQLTKPRCKDTPAKELRRLKQDAIPCKMLTLSVAKRKTRQNRGVKIHRPKNYGG